MQTNSVLAAIVEQAKEISFEEMKNLFPDEWVVVGNPVEVETQLEIVSGVPLVHGIDKKLVCWEGKKAIQQLQFESYTVVFTGQRSSPKRFMTGIFGRVQ